MFPITINLMTASPAALINAALRKAAGEFRVGETQLKAAQTISDLLCGGLGSIAMATRKLQEVFWGDNSIFINDEMML